MAEPTKNINEDASAADLASAINDAILAWAHGQPRTRRGTIVPGSWRSNEGTVEVEFGNNAAAEQTDVNGPLAHPRLPVATYSIGRQAGPRGGERAFVVPRPGGAFVILQHDADDVPEAVRAGLGAAEGEDVYVHLNEQGFADSWVTHRNDASTAGDGLGGTRINAGGFGRFRTNAKGASAGYHGLDLDDTGRALALYSGLGFKTLFDDANRVASRVSPNGLVHRMSDVTQQIQETAGNASRTIDGFFNRIEHAVTDGVGTTASRLDGFAHTIEHAVPAGGIVALGNTAAALAADPTKALIALGHLNQFEQALAIMRQADMVTLTTALVPYLNRGALALAAVQALGALTHVGLPTGTTKARAE